MVIWMSSQMRKSLNEQLCQRRYNINRSEAELSKANYRTIQSRLDLEKAVNCVMFILLSS